PEKSSTSVARNSHIPSRIASTCRASEAKWCPMMPSGRPSGNASCGTDHSRGLVGAVVVRHLGDLRDLVEVVGGGRRGGHPLEALRSPRVRLAGLSPAQR